MTSFVFQGPAIGGPANGRELVSYSQIFATLYPIQKNRSNVIYLFEVKPLTQYAIFRYQAHQYGDHRFFLPIGETLEAFLNQWQPPIKQDHWPAFLNHAIETLNGNSP